MYRFIQHRCQEKNDTRVKKRSTPRDGKISLEAKFKSKTESRGRVFCDGIAIDDNARGKLRMKVANEKSGVRSSLQSLFQHSITFSASPARLVSL